MEGNNTTTIGGVTFGGGNQPSPTPMPQPNNLAMPDMSNPSLNNEPVMPSANPTPLNVDIVSPTHFDPQPIEPVPQIQYQTIQAPHPQNDIPQPTDATDNSGKGAKKVSVMAIVFGIFMVVFLALSIVGFVLAIGKTSELADADATIAAKDKIIQAVEESTGVSPISSPEDVPVYKATTGYIYLSEWNIKIKIPVDLDKLSYYVDQNYREHICFNGLQKGVQYFPDFANIAKNTGRQGCLFRIKTSEGEFDAASGISFGTKVFTYKDYSFFYTPPIDFSTDGAELGLEHTADQIIKNMLTDNIEPYE